MTLDSRKENGKGASGYIGREVTIELAKAAGGEIALKVLERMFHLF